ncbi:MAG: hypothetical protein WCD70_05000 [Alphaproteobacteria bacterium]
MNNFNAQPPVCIKLTPEQHRLVRRYAKECGTTLSDYGRRRMLAMPDIQMVYQNRQTRKLMKEAIAQIGRVGNNMNQIAWKLNSDMMPNSLDRQLHEEGVESLKQMRGVLVAHLLKPPGPC